MNTNNGKRRLSIPGREHKVSLLLRQRDSPLIEVAARPVISNVERRPVLENESLENSGILDFLNGVPLHEGPWCGELPDLLERHVPFMRNVDLIEMGCKGRHTCLRFLPRELAIMIDVGGGKRSSNICCSLFCADATDTANIAASTKIHVSYSFLKIENQKRIPMNNGPSLVSRLWKYVSNHLTTP
ncbi:hypothetical protein [Paraburkholderia sp. MM5477-R1]|uniref:hypothetical protein n=1 Tax=Paraburkholderia sp. MM5477-R1 TaxID=2991062 RepID=UPI003D2070E7